MPSPTGRPPSRWAADPATSSHGRSPRRNHSCSSFSDLLHQSQLSTPTANKRAKTPPPTSPGARLLGSVRPHKAMTEKGPSRLPAGRRARADAESATPAAGIILLREKPAVSELDDAAWEVQELEVLIGRYEVVDALRSGRDRLVALRYPGEWHFPGGALYKKR